jgi:hypothetical protein
MPAGSAAVPLYPNQPSPSRASSVQSTSDPHAIAATMASTGEFRILLEAELEFQSVAGGGPGVFDGRGVDR